MNDSNMANYEIIIKSHKTVNQVRETVYSEALSRSSEEIISALGDQDVTEVKRMKRYVDGSLQNPHRYIFTFKRTELPTLIKLSS